MGKKTLPENLLRTKAHAVNHTSTEAHISSKPCQISSSLVFAAKLMGPKTYILLTEVPSRRKAPQGALVHYRIQGCDNLTHQMSLDRLCLIRRAQAPAR